MLNLRDISKDEKTWDFGWAATDQLGLKVPMSILVHNLILLHSLQLFMVSPLIQITMKFSSLLTVFDNNRMAPFPRIVALLVDINIIQATTYATAVWSYDITLDILFAETFVILNSMYA